MGKMFIFGLGFSARTIAATLSPQIGSARIRTQTESLASLVDEPWHVAGCNRSGQPPADLPGITTYRFDRQHPLPADALDGVTHILISVPPDAEGDPVWDVMGEAILRCQPRWVGYLSTTGLYGDHQGAWVDETTAPNPSQARSHARLKAEQAWLSSGLPIHIFRLAGIYGPGRSALDSMLAGTAHRILKPGQVFSRIHSLDIANTVLASIRHPAFGEIYNVCDDDPAPPQDVITFAADMLGLPHPPALTWDQAKAHLSPMALSFYADNKRVRNQKIKETLGVQLIFPSYRQGLHAIHQQRGDSESTPSLP